MYPCCNGVGAHLSSCTYASDVAEGDLEAGKQPDRDLAAHLLAPYGRSAAIENVGVSAAPLLAGFSFALVGLILGFQNPDKDIAEPNIALAALVVAALLLVNAVQCAFHARQYHVPPDEWESLVKLFPEGERRDQLWKNQDRVVKTRGNLDRLDPSAVQPRSARAFWRSGGYAPSARPGATHR